MSVERSRLANGLTVVSHAMAEVETVSLGIWVGAGSRSEAIGEHGIAHFLEHMAFKGTARRSAKDIAEEIEAVGGELNAATGVDSTAYYARVLRKDMPLALDILSDIIVAPSFEPSELARERDVILQEIAAAQDSPEDIAFDLVQEAAFPDQPVGRPILGTAKSVRRFKRAHLGSYLSSHYHGPSMVLAAAGAVDHKALVAEAELRLGSFDMKAAPLPEGALYQGGARRSGKPFEQTHLVLAFQGPAYRHPDYFTAQICAGALGGGMSSRLFQEVRERRGLCYAIYSFSSGLSDSGMFGIHAAGGPERAHELFGVIRDELVKAADEGFREEEISRVKAQIKMGLLAGLESSSARAEQLARQILIHGRPLTTEELIEKVEQVQAEDLQALVSRMLASPLSLATVGPILHVARFDRVAERFTVPSSRAA
ncbi:MAG TPA: pitrilysin family protein [Methyloceanibacter sp.]|nr:pitrilysin family protein [Methyloceanibacter sp.]